MSEHLINHKNILELKYSTAVPLLHGQFSPNYCSRHPYKSHKKFEGILPKGIYPPCLRMAKRTLLAGYPRYEESFVSSSTDLWSILVPVLLYSTLCYSGLCYHGTCLYMGNNRNWNDLFTFEVIASLLDVITYLVTEISNNVGSSKNSLQNHIYYIFQLWSFWLSSVC